MSYNSNTGNELLKSLTTPTYPIYQTSRLVGISRWTVKRYLSGYTYRYDVSGKPRWGQQPPVVNPDDESTYASFLDLVDLLYVKEFLSRNFSLPHIRQALDEAREYLGTPHFARSVFYTSGDQIILRLPKDGSLIALMTGGQLTIQEITEKLSDRLDFESVTEYGLAQRWYPNGRNGSIVIDPQLSFGRPTLVDCNVTTSSIYDLYLGEKGNPKPVSEWFGIPVAQIKTAVQFELSLWA